MPNERGRVDQLFLLNMVNIVEINTIGFEKKKCFDNYMKLLLNANESTWSIFYRFIHRKSYEKFCIHEPK